MTSVPGATAVPAVSDARVVVAVTAMLCMFAAPAEPGFVVPLVLAAALGTCLWLLLRPARPGGRTDVRTRENLTGAMAVVAAAVSGLQTATTLGLAPPYVVGVVAAFAVLAYRIAWSDAPRPRAFVALGALQASVLAWSIATVRVRIDVAEYLRGGAAALLQGRNPYAITVPDVYGPAESALYYGPGVVQDGRVVYGFPYFPAPLLLDLPGHLLGDVRIVHLVALLVTAGIAWRTSSDRTGRMLAVVLLAAPTSVFVMLAHWVEPVMSMLLALAVLAMLAGARWVALPLGLLLSSKQYLVVSLPALWLVARSAGWRAVAAACGLAAVLVAGFLLWDVEAFVRSVVLFQLRQPYRDDAVSLLPLITEVTGPLPSWLLGVPPLLAGLALSCLLALRLRPGATGFLLTLSLPLLLTVLVAKQAFTNYYWFIGAALALAATVWPVDDPREGGTRA